MTSPAKLRVLVADDSTIFRKVVRDALADVPDVEVVGHATNGAIAIEQLITLKPDLVTLDIEMPKKDGLEVLQEIKSRGLDTGAIMISASTGAGARATTKSLELGAFDFVLKPSGSDYRENTANLTQELIPRIRAFHDARAGKKNRPQQPQRSLESAAPTEVDDTPVAETKTVREFESPDVILMGVSTGGPEALMKVLPKLPSDLGVPILIVQHMPKMFTRSLAEDLNRASMINVVEASDGEPIKSGCCYIAPGGKQLAVFRRGTEIVANVNDDPPVRSCRPSVDYMFRSASKVWGKRILAVIMTGMGDDGSHSLREMYPMGVHVIAQDEATSTVYGMPRRVVEEGHADTICPLGSIAGTITRMIRRHGARTCV